MNRLCLFALMLTVMFMQPALADPRMQLEVIPLQHQLLQDVLPTLEPMVAPGGSITGMNDQLIIRSTPQNIAEIKQILNSLDRAPQQLMISVRQNVDGQWQQQDHAITGRYRDDNVRIEGDGRNARERLRAELERRQGGSDASIGYEFENRYGSDRDHNMHNVRATEGYPAFVQTGQSLPFPNRNTLVRPDGTIIVQDGTDYVDASSGFYALARLQGDRVSVEIAPRLSRLESGYGGLPVVQLQDVHTVVTGRLGEWLAVGGADQSQQNSSRRILGSGNQQSQEQRQISIKVDLIQ
ncbi:MAG: secretin N-terminal domain-containing protein [Gammaproteobacteria bacterium]